MASTAHGPVLVAYHLPRLRRILCLNLRAECIDAAEAATARECLDFLASCRPRAVLLDPEILGDHQDPAIVRELLRQLTMPVLVLSHVPEHRHLARLLGDAPFCNRPDDVDRVTAAIRGMLAGVGLPSLV